MILQISEQSIFPNYDMNKSISAFVQFTFLQFWKSCLQNETSLRITISTGDTLEIQLDTELIAEATHYLFIDIVYYIHNSLITLENFELSILYM